MGIKKILVLFVALLFTQNVFAGYVHLYDLELKKDSVTRDYTYSQGGKIYGTFKANGEMDVIVRISSGKEIRVKDYTFRVSELSSDGNVLRYFSVDVPEDFPVGVAKFYVINSEYQVDFVMHQGYINIEEEPSITSRKISSLNITGNTFYRGGLIEGNFVHSSNIKKVTLRLSSENGQIKQYNFNTNDLMPKESDARNQAVFSFKIPNNFPLGNAKFYVLDADMRDNYVVYPGLLNIQEKGDIVVPPFKNVNNLSEIERKELIRLIQTLINELLMRL